MKFFAALALIVLTTHRYATGQELQPVGQGSTVVGTVTDKNDTPLPGVNVVLEGTFIGVITDANGKYSITVPDRDAVLVFSSVGYIVQKVIVGERTVIDIHLTEDSLQLEEVVVVGYGTQKKVNLTGAITVVKFDEAIDNRPITNASQALSGIAPGLWVSQNSGKPGNDGAQLRVRGWGTLNNSDPLIIIDGVEGSFNQINPNDIESISILKDAASSAIYGSKAANGVILIKTKTGIRNEKTLVSISSYVGIQSLGRKFDLIDNSVENMNILNQAQINEGKSPIFPNYLTEAFQNGTDSYKYPNTNWVDIFFRNAIIHEHNLSIRGGTQNSSSFLSVNYLGQDGMVPNSQSYRIGVRANIEYDISNWFKAGGRFNYIRRIADEPYDLARVFEILRGSAPYIAPYTRDGRFGSSEAIDNNGAQLYDNRNPLIDAANGQQRTTGDFLTANAYVEIDFTKNLNLQATWSSTGRWGLTDKYNEPLFGYTDSGVETITKNYNREGIEMIRSQESAMQNNLYVTLNYNRQFGRFHELEFIGGLQTEDYSLKNVMARRSTPPKNGLTQVDAGTSGVQGEGNLVGVRMFSYFSRLNYSYGNKYLFETDFRADASSRFKEGNRWGYFPGFSAGWRLGEENFVKNLGVFSNLKLRVSWGQLGNQNVQSYWPYLTVINQNNSLSYNYNGSFSPGAAVTALVDENIGWETSTTLDFGADIGLLDGKFNLEVDYFHKITSGIIVQLPMPQILGNITPPYENVGKMLNEGFEANISYGNRIINREHFGYSVGINFSYVKNLVTKFRGGKSPDQLFLIREGYPYKVLYGYKAIGLYQSDDEAADHMYANSFIPKAGDLKFEDVNEDGKLGFEDKQAIGKTIPPVIYGITSKFNYKGFDLNILLQGLAGAYLQTRNQYTTLDLELQSITRKWKDAWTPENTDTDIPRLKLNSTWDNSDNSFWMHKSDFLKIKNIQLGYALPSDITSRLKVEKIYLYANAQNVHTIMWYKGFEGFDPESAIDGDGGGLYPVARVISFGLNINF
jgi:TonB-linked SusC/RagA family outer membrane protein